MPVLMVWGVYTGKEKTGPKERLRYLLVRLPDNRQITVAIADHPRGTRFFQNLFALSAMTYRVLCDSATDDKRIAPTVSEQDWAYRSVVRALDTIQAHAKTKRKRKHSSPEQADVDQEDSAHYPGIPGPLKLALRAILQPRNVHDHPTFTLDVTRDTLAFVSSYKLERHLQSQQHASWPTFEHKELLSPVEVAEIGENVRLSAQDKWHWLDLYHEKLRHTPLPSHHIALSASPLEKNNDETTSSLDRKSKACFAPKVNQGVGTPSVPLQEIVEKHRQVLIQGRAGSGKTVTLIATAQDCLRKNSSLPGSMRILPFLVPMRHLRKEQDSFARSLVCQAVMDTLSGVSVAQLRQCRNVPAAADQTESTMRECVRTAVRETCENMTPANAVILLDGLNEIPHTCLQDVHAMIHSFRESKYRIVATSRPWPCLLEGDTFPKWELSGLSPSQIRTYVSERLASNDARFYQEVIALSPRTMDLASLPFFLWMICEYAPRLHRVPDALTPTYLIGTFAKDAMSRKCRNGLLPELGPMPTFESCEYFLSELAFRIMQTILRTGARSLEFPAELLDITLPAGDVDRITRICEACGLLRLDRRAGPIGRAVEFAHDYFLYYYAACYLSRMRHEDLRKTLDKYIEYVEWDVPLAMHFQLSTDVHRNDELVRSILNADHDLGLTCAVQAVLSERLLESLIACEAKVNIARTLITPELQPRVPRQSLLIAHLPKDEILQLASSVEHAPPDPNAVMAIPYAFGPRALEALTKVHGTHHDWFVDFCGYAASLISTLGAFEFALELVDETGGEDSLRPTVLAGTLPERLAANEIWKYATSDRRARAIAKEFQDLCEPRQEDRDLLRKLLRSKDDVIAVSAARLLLQLEGRRALPQITRRIASITQDDFAVTEGLRHIMAEGNRSGADLSELILQKLADLSPSYFSLQLTSGKDEMKEATALASERALDNIALRAAYVLSDDPAVRACWMDTLAAWPNRMQAVGAIKAIKKDFDFLDILLQACLNVSEHRKYVDNFVRHAEKADWNLEARRKVDSLLETAWRTTNGGMARKALFDPDLRECAARYDYLHCAIRACRVLKVRAIVPMIPALMKVAEPGAVLFAETLRTYIDLSPTYDLQWFVSRVEKIPLGQRDADDRMNYIRQLCLKLLPEERRSLMKLYSNRIAERVHAAPGQEYEYFRDVLAYLIDEGRFGEDSQLVADKIRELRSRESHEEHRSRLDELFFSVQQASGRRFLLFPRPSRP